MMRRILLALGLLSLASPALAQNYNATAGSGLVFGSKFVTSVNYPQVVFCDPTTPAQCVAVNASGQLTLVANQSVNVAQINGVTPLMGNGVTGTGSPRVTIASDNTAFSVNAVQSGTWTVQPGNTANTTAWKVDNSAVTQPVSSTTLATAANQATEITSLGTIATNTAAAQPAGENHIGEIASNQIKVQVAQTVTSASAYASGNAIGDKMTIANAARISGSLGAAGTGGILTGLTMNAKSLQTTQVDVFLFDADPSSSTCTNKSPFSLATADFDKVIGVITIPGTAANGAGWYAGTVGSAGVATYYPVTYDLASATSIFACAVTRGTPTFTASTDVSFKFNILRN